MAIEQRQVKPAGYIRISEAAERLCMTRQGVHHAVQAGILPAVKVGEKLWFVEERSVANYKPMASGERRGGPKGERAFMREQKRRKENAE